MSSTVVIADDDFAPNSVTVESGATVTWSNHDENDHWVVSAPSDPIQFDLGREANGVTVNFTFVAPGNYSYYCKLHNFMKGTVVVK